MTIPLVSFSGLSTGIDTNALVSSLVAVARRPVVRLESQQANLNAQSRKLTDIRAKLLALQNAARALDERSEVLPSTATSADSSVATATAASDAELGTHAVQVTALARPAIGISGAFAARDQAGLFGEGTLRIRAGSAAEASVTVSSSDTLDVVVTKINESGADVTAGLVNTGNGWRIAVTGKKGGAANQVAFTETGSLSLDLDLAGNQVQAACDAVFTVDGIAMTRTSNAVTDAIPGVTLDLTGVSGASATSVTVARDTAALQTKAEAFVKSYNEVVKALNAEFAWNGVAKGADSLSGDSTLRSLQGRLRAVVGQRIPGIAPPYDTLAAAGIAQGRDGTLTLDPAKLSAALSASPNSVVSLFVDNTSGGTDGVMAQLSVAADDFVRSSSGALSARIEGIADRVKALADQITQMGLRLDTYEETLRRRFSALEELVSGLQSQGAQMNSVLSSLQKGG